MRWLSQLGDEDGVTAVLVGLLMVPLLGVGALVIDVGFIYYEVRQLQNGADAAALAVAQDCAGGDCGAWQATADSYTDANADDGASDAAVALPGNAGGNSVTVTATTRSADGSDRLTYRLATVFDTEFDASFERSATAAWGGIGSGTTIPIALCEHAWDHFTSNGTVLPSGPPAHILRVGVPPGHVDEDVDCSNPGGGDPPPGGFGFLDADENCQANVYAGEWMDGEAGNNPDVTASSCTATRYYENLIAAIDSGTSVLIPIFDEYQEQGADGRYRIIGFGGFRLEGYKMNAGPQHPVHGRSYQWAGSCPGSASCLRGYFTEFIALDGEFPSGGGGDEYGAMLVRLVE